MKIKIIFLRLGYHISKILVRWTNRFTTFFWKSQNMGKNKFQIFVRWQTVGLCLHEQRIQTVRTKVKCICLTTKDKFSLKCDSECYRIYRFSRFQCHKKASNEIHFNCTIKRKIEKKKRETSCIRVEHESLWMHQWPPVDYF